MDPHSWSLHWDVLLAIGALAAAYFWSQRRWPADARRRVAFDLAVILLLAVYVTPLHTIALHYLLSVHLLQNVVTAEWAPGLVVFALAPALARELERFAAVQVRDASARRAAALARDLLRLACPADLRHAPSSNPAGS